jgi:hypothetical protein
MTAFGGKADIGSTPFKSGPYSTAVLGCPDEKKPRRPREVRGSRLLLLQLSRSVGELRRTAAARPLAYFGRKLSQALKVFINGSCWLA